jgi:hypothetical protein
MKKQHPISDISHLSSDGKEARMNEKYFTKKIRIGLI